MRNPEPPFLELGFFLSRLNGNQALEKLVRHLVYKRRSMPRAIIASRNSLPGPAANAEEATLGAQRRIDRVSDLWKALGDPAQQIHKVMLEGATRIVSDCREIAAVLSTGSKGVETSGSCVAIWTEGESLSHPADSFGNSSTGSMGRKAIAAFRDLVLALSPAYGAITVDYGLESPEDLMNDPRTYAFTDFYLDREFIGHANLQQIRNRFPNACHEQFGRGQLTISSSFLIAESKCGRDDAYELSECVGRLIGRNTL